MFSHTLPTRKLDFIHGMEISATSYFSCQYLAKKYLIVTSYPEFQSETVIIMLVYKFSISFHSKQISSVLSFSTKLWVISSASHVFRNKVKQVWHSYVILGIIAQDIC